MKGRKTNTHCLVRLLAMVFSAAALQACAAQWGGGVHLPRGDAVKGRETFVDLRCHACHEIEGFDPPTPIVAATRVMLGGQTTRIRTYDDLLTAIANPSHRLARGYPPEAVAVDGVPLMSLIRLNDVMTVQQLVDLAAFLQTEYEVVPPPIRLDDGTAHRWRDDFLARAPTMTQIRTLLPAASAMHASGATVADRARRHRHRGSRVSRGLRDRSFAPAQWRE